MDVKKLVTFVAKDKDQLECIKELVNHRKGNLREYVKNGIFYVPDLNELDYVIGQIGTTKEDLGITEDMEYLFEGGFIIPVMDSNYEVLYYVNYNFLRDKSKKYINVYTVKYKGKEQSLKLYGMHHVKKALKEDRIVVVEGIFDVLRLAMYGIPAVAMLGTAFMPYHKSFFQRFKRVIFIPDNDDAGESSWRKFKKAIPTSEVYRIAGTDSDVDDFGAGDSMAFKEWIKELQELGNKTIK